MEYLYKIVMAKFLVNLQIDWFYLSAKELKPQYIIEQICVTSNGVFILYVTLIYYLHQGGYVFAFVCLSVDRDTWKVDNFDEIFAGEGCVTSNSWLMLMVT